MSNVLVTGGAGFIGSHIATALVRSGHRVRVLDNLSTGFEHNLAEIRDDVELQVGDVADPVAVKTAVADCELIFHQAALASVPRSVEQPLDTHSACVTGTVQLLDAARQAGVRRVIYAASSSAYGDFEASSKRETDPTSPLSPYAAAKLAGEVYCQTFAATYGLETVCIRYFNVFGPRQDPASPYSAVIPIFVDRMLNGKQPIVFGDGLQSRDFTFVENVVRGNLLAATVEGVSGEVINVASGRSYTLLELIEQLNRLLGMEVQPEFQPPRVGDVRDSLADIAKARRLLGYEVSVPFAEGLEQTVDYYRSLVRDPRRAASSR